MVVLSAGPMGGHRGLYSHLGLWEAKEGCTHSWAHGRPERVLLIARPMGGQKGFYSLAAGAMEARQHL